MADPLILCPKCKASITLTDSVAAPLLEKTKRQLERKVAQRESDLAKQEAELRKSALAIKNARQSMKKEIAKKIQLERASIAADEVKKARAIVARDMKARDMQLVGLQNELKANNAKLVNAQRTQADVLRKRRELENAKRELDLSVEKKVQAALETVREQARTEADEILRLKVAEREIQIAGMQRQIESLRRKAKQGSQQMQGEALEQELESLLRQRFPKDLIAPVPVGESGGDIVQHVSNSAGKICGKLLWECKHTSNWNDRWLVKIKADQRSAKADVAILVSTMLPSTINTFDCIDNVWVTKPRFALPLSIVLRQSMIELQSNRIAADGQQTKLELVYQYLTGAQFRRRMDSIIEHFTYMQTDLDRERKTMMRVWAKRDQQLQAVLNSSAGLYGDLQGIVGRALPDIETLLMIEHQAAGTNGVS